MRASVVIPTFNRVDDLKRVVDALDRQALPSWASLEVVVVDDGSSDGTWAWLKGRRRLGTVALTQDNSGPARARNRGVRIATGDVVLFLGDDTVPEEGWLWEHLQAHRLAEGGQPTAVLGYTSFPAQQDSAFLRWINEFGAQFGYLIIEDAANVPFNFFYTSNISLPRAEFLTHDGFREDFPAAAWEDIEFAYRATRAGLRIVYRPRARTIHHHRIEPRTFCLRQRKAGRSAAIFAQLHPELEDFLGVNRIASFGARGWLARSFLLAAIAAGERVPGLIPGGLFRRLTDMSYLDGLATGLRSGHFSGDGA